MTRIGVGSPLPTAWLLLAKIRSLSNRDAPALTDEGVKPIAHHKQSRASSAHISDLTVRPRRQPPLVLTRKVIGKHIDILRSVLDFVPLSGDPTTKVPVALIPSTV